MDDSDIFDLPGKVAVVTGAARGLGKAAAVGLATFGADVATIDLAAENCKVTIGKIKSLGRKGIAYACDVAEHPTVERTVKQVHADFGRIDILVNIAGITARIPTDQIPPDQVRRLTEVNYYGTFWDAATRPTARPKAPSPP